ncbi:MAG: primosomal protein N' [Oscillochloris sp.]|nr:primosomal protein N' [Oscillochloris sp.]
MPIELIAEVALRATVAGGMSPTYSYRVPPRLRGRIHPGQLVWAPLRRRRVQGVVLSVGQAEFSDRVLRELEDIGDPAASVTPAGLELAEWVATTYRAPLYEALALLLPPGVSQEAVTTWRINQAGLRADLGALPERERAILYYLRQHGEQSERELRAVLRGADGDLRAAYQALAERGLIERGATITAPRARPRRERTVRLDIDGDAIDAALHELSRAPKQAAVLRWLAEHRIAQGEDDDEAPPTPELIAREVYAATGANATLLKQLEQRGLVRFGEREIRRDPLAGDGVPPDQPPLLTASQRAAFEQVAGALEQTAGKDRDPANGAHPPEQKATMFLLFGITGSGKTEIYLRAIARVMRLGRQALVLVPEIALTAQLVRRFAARFPGKLAVLHSGLSMGERYDEWRRLRSGEARLAIGSRSVVFAPLPELGLIIVDEEHELTYKHDAGPRYHARDAAIKLAEISGSVLILGSATPSVESFYAAGQGRLRMLELPERVGGGIGVDGLPRSEQLPLPPVQLIDMRRELQSGNRSIFSRSLQLAIDECLSRREQVILFLNRRGAAAFVMCRDCGNVVGCPACSSPLTLHYDEVGDDGQSELLICHSCGFTALVPPVCPSCLSPRIKRFGIGTQRVAEEVTVLFPQARVLRWDRDSVRGKGAHTRMLDTFLRYEADVLVGTQMIAKGLDLPMVALVGVVAADTGLHLPDFRSGERAFQLLTQVAGRAGRRTAGAKVIIQTYDPEHYALRAAQEHDYVGFYAQEIAYRKSTGYPPFGRLVRFVCATGTEAAGKRESDRLHARLAELLERRRLEGWSIIGPAPAFLQRTRGRWRWHLILRLPIAAPVPALNGLLDALGPIPNWSIDVDPVHVL